MNETHFQHVKSQSKTFLSKGFWRPFLEFLAFFPAVKDKGQITAYNSKKGESVV